MTPITLQGIRPWRALLVAVFAMALTVQSIPVAAQSVTIPPWRVSGDSAREKATITVGEHKLVTDLALTSKQQQLGLGYRNSLGWDEAMLFVNKAPEPQSFWMKGMRFCLDIIWIEGGKIVGAAENTCPDPPGTPDPEKLRVSSPEPVTYVLEVNAGWLAAHGYGVGTEVVIPDLAGS
jgi:uncharacterized membrane protein (UPF0127 family)